MPSCSVSSSSRPSLSSEKSSSESSSDKYGLCSSSHSSGSSSSSVSRYSTRKPNATRSTTEIRIPSVATDVHGNVSVTAMLLPTLFLAYPIMNSSMTNSLVLDPFGGSGSTLIACEQTGRICYTIELDEKFCDVIVKRYIEQVGSSGKISVIRDGLTYSYDEIVP